MHRIAAELALEVLARLEHEDVDALSGEEQCQHHAARATAHDDAVSLAHVGCSHSSRHYGLPPYVS